MTSLLLAMLLSCSSTDPRTDQLEAQVAELAGRLRAMEDEVDRLRSLLAEHPPASTRSSGPRTSSSIAAAAVTGIFPRTLVDELIEDPDEADKLARAIPHRDAAGDLDGYRLSAIRRASPLAVAGLKNGDIIHAVNGHALAAPDLDLTTLLNDLKGRDELTIDLTRRGTRDRALTITVE